MAEGSVDFDVGDVVSFFKRAATSVSKESVDKLNHAAFKLRKIWRETIESEVSNPTRFTTSNNNVVVDRASTFGDPVATVRVNHLQKEYLNFLVEGLIHKGSDDLGTSKGQIVHPMGADLNEFGNFPKGAPRWLSGIKRGKISPNAFIGTPRYSNGSPAIRAVFERAENHDPHLKLLAVFVDHTKEYKKTLPLFEIAEAEFENIFREVEASIDKTLDL